MRAGDVLEVTAHGDPGGHPQPHHRVRAAAVVCRGRPDRCGSAAEVLDPPIVAVTATGTVVVPRRDVRLTRVGASAPTSGPRTRRWPWSTWTPARWWRGVARRPRWAPTCCTAWTPRSRGHRRARRPRRALVRLLVGRWWAAAGRGRLRAAGHRAGRPPGRVVRRGAGGARGRRAGWTRRTWRRCGRPARTWCCWSAAPTAATPRCCAHNATRLAAGPAGGCRWWSPATPTSATSCARCWRRAGCR